MGGGTTGVPKGRRLERVDAVVHCGQIDGVEVTAELGQVAAPEHANAAVAAKAIAAHDRAELDVCQIGIPVQQAKRAGLDEHERAVTAVTGSDLACVQIELSFEAHSAALAAASVPTSSHDAALILLKKRVNGSSRRCASALCTDLADTHNCAWVATKLRRFGHHEPGEPRTGQICARTYEIVFAIATRVPRVLRASRAYQSDVGITRACSSRYTRAPSARAKPGSCVTVSSARPS